jgi:hypothetical protein
MNSAYLTVGSIFHYATYHRDKTELPLYHITKITDKQIQYRECVLTQIEPGSADIVYVSFPVRIAYSSNSDKTYRMNKNKLSDYNFIAGDDLPYSTERNIPRCHYLGY